VDGPEKIERARDQGFRMVKVSIPRIGYDDPTGFPLWERAAAHGMPVLFHTGVITTAVDAPREDISSWNMHPMRIEPITRAFPHLKIIVAHLGIHWNDDAAELARMRPNVYVDITGEPGGWRARMDAVGVEKWLWWPGAFDKVCFGTDVHHTKIRLILEEDLARLDALGIGEETRRRIFCGNILHLLGDDEA
jgi:predicted TIM-barrel fold metal-dependent hydrolase